LNTESRTIIFYESPHRLRATLQDLAEVMGGERQIVLARELTKYYEEFWRGTVEEACRHYQEREPQGEYTVLIGGVTNQTQLTESQIKAELQKMIDQGIARSQASREIALLTSLPRRYVYQLALEIED
jgi:16S rRNA (cytidine1402-2'-O)-methyltransferase